MTDESKELNELLRKTLDKLDKSEKRQNELESKLVEMEKLLSVDEENTAPAAPHDDSDVHNFVREVKKERDEKKRKKDERLHVKSEAELDSGAAKLLERMLHSVSEGD